MRKAEYTILWMKLKLRLWKLAIIIRYLVTLISDCFALYLFEKQIHLSTNSLEKLNEDLELHSIQSPLCNGHKT